MRKIKPFGVDPKKCKGRLYNEKEKPFCTGFFEDKFRLINSTIFRRLEGKTQVFGGDYSDHNRNRLTHSIEVAQIASWVSIKLGLNQEVAEIISLAHDLGHSPFGHAGERVLNEKMKKFGGFSHNDYVLKLLTKIEKRSPNFDGLNLMWESLEGIVKHNGPILENLTSYIGEYNQIHDLDVGKFSSLESQIASISDDIAYINHDIEDAMRVGLLERKSLIEVEFIDRIIRKIEKEYGDLDQKILVVKIKNRLTRYFVEDLIANIRQNLSEYNIKTLDDVRNLGCLVGEFSQKVDIEKVEIKNFLYNNVYNHYSLKKLSIRAEQVISGIFDFFVENTECLPHPWRQRISSDSERDIHIVVCDYIAGMTDHFAIKEYKQINDI